MKRLLQTVIIPLLALGWGTGCDWDHDDDDDHVPAPGKGAILVDNNTGDDIRIYVDGIQLGRAEDYSDRAFDLDPGLHRVVLDEVDGDRDYREDLDIIEGRLTVLDVTVDFDDYDDYDVDIFFD